MSINQPTDILKRIGRKTEKDPLSIEETLLLMQEIKKEYPDYSIIDNDWDKDLSPSEANEFHGASLSLMFFSLINHFREINGRSVLEYPTVADLKVLVVAKATIVFN